MNLENFNYRREVVNPKEIFPHFNVKDFKRRFGKKSFSDPHQTILETALELWEGGYDDILKRYGFHDSHKKFSGHCHQITPALGLVLLARGFKASYLECYMVNRETLQKIPPEQEPNPETREEFCSIGRIPYCCLEVEVAGEKLYLSGKHIKKVNGKPQALLTYKCYRPMIGVFPHQDAPFKSGIYLKPVQEEPLLWKKKKKDEPQPEYFLAFAHMTLTL